MTIVRERRKHKALSLTLPSIKLPNSWQHFLSPSPLSSTSSNSPSIDSPVKSLEKLQVLGHGNGGTVYKVRHRPTNTVYALKVLRFRGNKEALQQQAIREAEILRKVDSRFVVMCHGVLENGFADSDESGDLCFLIEYMEGGSLHDLLRKHKRLSEDVISCIARNVLEGLHYLHGMQIVHRDIKPSNLLLNSNGEVKITDFGVSKFASTTDAAAKEVCSNNSYMGTCAYMSPERIDPERWGGNYSYGFAGDVWSLGVVVMECCVGRFPLIGSDEKPDWVTLMCAICFEEKMEMPETASMELRSFVGKCLVKDWRARGTVEELLNHPFVSKFKNSSLEGLLS